MQSYNMKNFCLVVFSLVAIVICVMTIGGFEYLYRSSSSLVTMLPMFGTKMEQQSVTTPSQHTLTVRDVQLSAIIRTRPPTQSPVYPTGQPSFQPSNQPTSRPSQPSSQPTRQPSRQVCVLLCIDHPSLYLLSFPSLINLTASLISDFPLHSHLITSYHQPDSFSYL